MPKLLFRLIALVLLIPSISFARKAEQLVAVVYGNATVATHNDRIYVKSRATSVVRALKESSIDADLFSDTALEQALQAPHRVVHLVSVESLTPEQSRAVKTFTDAGGKLIVYGWPAKEIQSIIGISTPARAYSLKNPFTGFKFTGQKPFHCPGGFKNTARMVIQAHLDPKKTKTLAHWVHVNKQLGPPAVVKIPHGYWVSLVLLDEEQAQTRCQFFASLSAADVPEVWRYAAKKLDTELWESFDVSSYERFCKKVNSDVLDEKEHLLHDQLASANYLIKAKEQDFKKGLFGASMSKLWRLKSVLNGAWATAHSIELDSKVVAIWDKFGTGFFNGNWAATAMLLKRAGITDYYVLAAAPGKPHNTAFLKNIIIHCHKNNIRVHAWMPSGTLEYMPAAQRKQFVKDGRALVDSENNPVEWMDPRDARNSKMLADMAIQLVKDTGVDGIHFDYMRYPNEEATTGIEDRAVFEKWIGKKATRWPQDVAIKARLRDDFNKWRSIHVDAYLNDLTTQIRKECPKTILSVAVYGHGRYNDVGQNWFDWPNEKYVDYIVPMNYAATTDRLGDLLFTQRWGTDIGDVVSGIGVSSYEASLTPVETLEQIKKSLSYSVKGIAFYHMDERFRSEILPTLEKAK